MLSVARNFKFWSGMLAVLVVAVAVDIYGNYKYEQGYKVKATEAALELAELKNKSLEAQAILQKKVNEVEGKYHHEAKHHKATIAKLNADLRSLNRRLHVNVKPAQVCADNTASTASLANGTTRAELDAETAAALVALTDEGDLAIIKLNALQDWVESTQRVNQED